MQSNQDLISYLLEILPTMGLGAIFLILFLWKSAEMRQTVANKDGEIKRLNELVLETLRECAGLKPVIVSRAATRPIPTLPDEEKTAYKQALDN